MSNQDQRGRSFWVAIATIFVVSFLTAYALAAEPKKTLNDLKKDSLESNCLEILEAHEPLHIDQIHRLVELLRDDKPTIDDTAKALNFLLVEDETIEISVIKNSDKWRPIHIVVFDDVNHKKNEEGTER